MTWRLGGMVVVVVAACGNPANKAIDAALPIDGTRASDAPVSDAPVSDAPVSDDAGSDAVMAAHLVVTPDHNDYGAVIIGCVSATTTLTFTNAGATATGVLTTTISGSDSGEFHIVTDSCAGQDLAPAASCTIGVRFAPTSPGARAASLVVTGAAATASVVLLGTGLAASPFSIIPSLVDFGVVAPGTTSAPRTLTVMQAAGCTTTGPLSLTRNGIDPAQFAVATDTCSGTTLAGGASCTLGVTYTAKASGTSSASVTVMASPGGVASAGLQGE